MKRYIFQLVVLASVLQLTEVRGQTSLSASDLYRNFAGTWVGTGDDFPGSKNPSISVHLIVTVKKNGKAMHWVTTYGDKGQPNYHRAERDVIFDMAKGTVNYGGLLLQSSDLPKFARTGLGPVSGIELNGEPGKLRRGVFDLKPDALAILWESTVDGKNLATDGFFTYRREAAVEPVKP
ncbi:MAG TPA: hypothetical protein VN678_08170 [Acidobacteriaceae bacterium]|nr:hypothetical protein [Acidobacteriaceae bacterium]